MKKIVNNPRLLVIISIILLVISFVYTFNTHFIIGSLLDFTTSGCLVLLLYFILIISKKHINLTAMNTIVFIDFVVVLLIRCIYIIKLLIENGAKIKVYDPQAMLEAKSIYLTGLDVEYCNNKYDCINNCDAMVLLTEWKEFKSPDFEEIKKRLNSYIIFDGRNQYDSDYLTNLGFEYYQIGK